MYQTPASLIRQTFDHFECPICCEGYDENEHYPMIMCSHQHSCCQNCLKHSLFKGKKPNETIPCPFCKVAISIKNAQRFRMLNQLRITAQRLRVHGSSIKNDMRVLSEEKGSLQNQLKAEQEKNEWLIQQIQQIKGQHYELAKEHQTLQIKYRSEVEKNQGLTRQLSRKDLEEIKFNQEKGLVQVLKVDHQSFKKLNNLAFQSRQRLQSTHRKLKEKMKTHITGAQGMRKPQMENCQLEEDENPNKMFNNWQIINGLAKFEASKTTQVRKEPSRNKTLPTGYEIN